jgi:O-succinylbenzoic acid--CoA ligase
MPPGDEFAAALDEAWRTGAAVLPVDPQLPASARTALLHAMDLEAGVGEGVALVITTSGSTGEPKGVELTHDALAASAQMTMRRIGLDDGDRWLACMPWHHIGGLQVLLRARQFDTPLVVHERFDVDRFAAQRDVTLLSLVPTQLVRLLDAGVDLDRFRVILLGGAAPAPTLLARARAAGGRVVTTYGMSETCGGCVYDGLPLDGVHIGVTVDGRVKLRGPMLMSGYRSRPDLTAGAIVDGWLVTNDLGAVAEDGRLHVLGRADDVVITGGENVVTTEVAARLATHPQVRDVAVTGVDDPEWGQRVVAVVVADGDPPTLRQLREWCMATLPRAAAPRQLLVVDELPLLASGKLDRAGVAVLAAAAAATR